VHKDSYSELKPLCTASFTDALKFDRLKSLNR